MEETKETVDETTTENSTQETNDQAETIDYDKELADAVEKFETKEHNEKGYAQRKAKAEESVDETQAQLDDMEARVTAAIEKTLPKFIPKLQATLVEDNVETILGQLAPGNEAKQKLIRFHFENSVGLNGSLRERLENALLIADKKTILKTHKEMAVALQNRQGLSTTGQGSSTEGVEVKDSLLSKEQINDLKARGWDDKKIQRFKDNLRK
jgi:hypothetical protein